MYKTGPNNRGPDTSADQSRRRKYHNKGMNRKSHLELLADESVVVTARRAVHTDRGRKAQGKLLVTDRRLIFQTNWLDSWFFCHLPWSYRRSPAWTSRLVPTTFMMKV